MTKINIKLKDGLALGALVGVALFNPFTNQYIVDATVNGLIFISREFGVEVTLAGLSYFVGYILWNMWTTREKTNIPKKSAKTQRAGKLIET